jgi:hypothetical protein
MEATMLTALIPVLGRLADPPPRRAGGWSDLRIILCSLLMRFSDAPTLLDRFLGLLGA